MRPAGRPKPGDPKSARVLYYWTTRFIAWDATDVYGTAHGPFTLACCKRLISRLHNPIRSLRFALAAKAFVPLLCFRLRATYRRYATSTNMSREAFGEEVLVYANLNNWGGRFITPGPFDNTSRIFFVSHASVAAMV